MGTVYAPRLGDQWAAPIRHGTSAAQIDRGGVGHYTETQWPDEPGNFALAGHRNTNASMLGNQDNLQIGDPIYVVSYDGIYIYEVQERQVVLPSQAEVLSAVPSAPEAEAEFGVLTFTTCHPLFSNRERLIHHAEIVDFVPLGGEAPEELVHHEPISEMFYAGVPTDVRLVLQRCPTWSAVDSDPHHTGFAGGSGLRPHGICLPVAQRIQPIG